MSTYVFDALSLRLFRETCVDGDAPAHDTSGRAVWIDLVSPTRHELETVGHTFGFHSLAIEDASKRRQRPKLDVYERHIFMTFYAIENDTENAFPSAHEISIFADRSVVVTVRDHDIEAIGVAASRWAEYVQERPDGAAAMLVYTIADSVVDGYFPCLDRLADDIDALEARMFEGADQDALQDIFGLKRGLLDLRRVVAPTREVFNALIRRELPFFGGESVFFFQDVYDHVIRITDAIDADREVLTSAVDVYLTLASHRTNQTVRTLTIASIILMSMTLIAGIYGMNFVNIPELGWRYGYFGALGAMVIVGGIELLFFRRVGWW